MQSFEKEKKLAASVSMLSNFSLIVIKIIAGVITGSISILSEAVHSFSDLLASFIAFFSVMKSTQPADEDHSFGHGKYEDLSGLLEGLLIIFASLYISYEALKKIVYHTSVTLQIDLCLYVMLFSVLLNTGISAYLFHIAKKSESMAIFADAEHLRTDVYSSVGVCFGMLLIKLTGNSIFDPITALIVAVMIFSAGYKICQEASANLLDQSLNKQDCNDIKCVVENFVNDRVISIKHIRTRKSGIKKNIEITLIVNENMTIGCGHKICDEIEAEIDKKLSNTDITIHLEPNQ